jgi:hypothetical protein
MSDNPNKHPKGYNNPNAWNKIDGIKSKAIAEDFSEIEDLKYTDIFESDNSFNNVDENEDIDEIEVKDLDEDQINEEVESFGEVLNLVSLDSNPNYLPTESGAFAVAKYDNIDLFALTDRATKESKMFVQKITGFIIEFGDVELTEKHKKYLKEVGDIEIQNLADLQRLALINNQMINNISERINATTAEDYAVIQSYTNLLNLQIKLRKEIQTTYTGIPNRIKKMKSDIICNQELGSGDGPNDGPMTEDYGDSQFNNQKHLLAKLAQKLKNKSDELPPKRAFVLDKIHQENTIDSISIN